MTDAGKGFVRVRRLEPIERAAALASLAIGVPRVGWLREPRLPIHPAALVQ